MATIYEVSKLAGVSLATVSRVINDSSCVSSKTREKVVAAMQELGFRPSVDGLVRLRNHGIDVDLVLRYRDAGFTGIEVDDLLRLNMRGIGPEDVRALAHPVLRHRILTNFHAESEGITTGQLIDQLLEAVPVPTSGL